MSNTDNSPTAFVLMKFSGDPWSDHTYKAICAVVEEAGYRPFRADEIRTSGPVVDEVCKLMREVPRLLIDTSGDSHSVSYELGYAHGAGRPHDTTVVLRSQAAGAIPFNYAHFRLLVYFDRRHLKRLLRSWLASSVPIRDDDLGFAINFSTTQSKGDYGDAVASAILVTLKSLRFSGRCEYYAGNPVVPGESFYVVALALRDDKGRFPKREWWISLARLVSAELDRGAAKVALSADLSEIGEIRSFREHYLPRGVVEFVNGDAAFILGGDQSDDSWFLGQCRERMALAHQTATGRTRRSSEPGHRASSGKRRRSRPGR